jgi:mannose/cellobiose epimerase-like protein (N-acyl-D-glucosamine 2-epimerase family)
MFFHMTADGSPIRKRRYAYSEAFAAIAFAAHANTTKNDESAQKAKDLLERSSSGISIHLREGHQNSLTLAHDRIISSNDRNCNRSGVETSTRAQ